MSDASSNRPNQAEDQTRSVPERSGAGSYRQHRDGNHRRSGEPESRGSREKVASLGGVGAPKRRSADASWLTERDPPDTSDRVRCEGGCSLAWRIRREMRVTSGIRARRFGRSGQDDAVDIVVAAIVGRAGLESTLAAVEAGKRVALANKETLVVAGPVVSRAMAKSGAELLPVDSEHSAIFQCIGSSSSPPKKLILTASGGPFRTWTSRADGGSDSELGTCPSDLGNGAKNHHRFSHDDEQIA